MCQPRLPIAPDDPSALCLAAAAAAASEHDAQALPCRPRLHDRLTWKHDEAQERLHTRRGVFRQGRATSLGPDDRQALLAQAGLVDVHRRGLGVAAAMTGRACRADAGLPVRAIGTGGSLPW